MRRNKKNVIGFMLSLMRFRLTRIRLQRAIYFCLRKGEFARKHCRTSNSVSDKTGAQKFGKKLYLRQNRQGFTATFD